MQVEKPPAPVELTDEEKAASGARFEGSFSVVSKPNFASKYAFESSRRDLQNTLFYTDLESYF